MHTGIPEEKRPDYFDRLQELIGCGSLELIQEDGKCRLVYLMNDAAESFLVFEEAVVTGFCDKKIMDNQRRIYFIGESRWRKCFYYPVPEYVL